MKPLTEADIRSSFVNATPEEVQRMPLPGLHETLWNEREYLGWRDPQAARLGYLVHWADDRPVGVLLRAAAGSLRSGIAAMCSFCHTAQPATQVRLFSAPRAGEAGRNGDTVGTYICEDLACSHLIRTVPPHLNPPQLIAQRGEAMLGRVENFTAGIMRTA
ncbi:FBP domain-containing protein [Okibacterium endophyticum]